MPGSSKYPKTLDGIPADKGSSTDAREGKPTAGPEGDHSGHHNKLAAGVNAVQETLGVNPQGKRTTVAERMGVIEGEIEEGLGKLPEDIPSKEELQDKADLEGGKLVEAQLPDSVESGGAISRIQVTPVDHGAKFDKKNTQECGTTEGSKAFTLPGLTGADAGKVIVVEGAGANGGALVTTIATAAAGSGTLAIAASATIAAARAAYATDDSAAWVALAATMTPGSGYRIACPHGGAFLNQIAFGSVASVQGVTIELAGPSDRGTVLTPISAAGAKTMFTFNGPGDSTGEALRLTNVTIGIDYNDPIFDLAPNEPIVHMVGITGFHVDTIARHYGTGTLYKLDGSYQGTFEGVIKTGRYAIGIEIDDEVGSPPQMDTIRFGRLVHNGNYGLVLRGIAGGIDDVWLPIKSAVYTPEKENGKALNGHEDREFFGEGHLAEEAAAATTTIKLEAGQAATLGYETANLPLPILIDYGDHVEPNRVVKAEGDKLTLSQPLRWAHAAAKVVMRGTVAISLPTNHQSVRVGPMQHIEGHSGAAVMTDSGALLTVEGGLSSNRAVVRVCGGASDVRLSRIAMVGAGAWLGAGGEGAHNVGLEVPSWNTNASLSRLTIDELTKAGTEAVMSLSDPGNNAKKVYSRTTVAVSGVPQTTHNVPKEDAASTSTQVLEQLNEENESRWQRFLNGNFVWRADTRMKRRGAGSIAFETLSAGVPEETKTVALGAGSVRFGEDTVITRAAKKLLEVVGSLMVKGGVITVYLSGAITNATDALVEAQEGVPKNGMLAVVYNTSTSKTYFCVRANGTWQVMAGPV